MGKKRQSKDELMARIADLEVMILEFADGSKELTPSDDYKNLPHVKPLLDEAESIVSEFMENKQ